MSTTSLPLELTRVQSGHSYQKELERPKAKVKTRPGYATSMLSSHSTKKSRFLSNVKSTFGRKDKHSDDQESAKDKESVKDTESVKDKDDESVGEGSKQSRFQKLVPKHFRRRKDKTGIYEMGQAGHSKDGFQA